MENQKTLNSTNTRDLSLDLMKGIAIIAVIVGHLTTFGRQFIFSFHMPLFFIIAGYLYRRKNIKTVLKQDFSRLIIPYIATAVFIIIFYLIVNKITGKFDYSYWVKAALWGSGSRHHKSPIYGDYPCIGAIWFLLALFWCKFLFTVFEIYIKNKYILTLFCITLSLIAQIIDNKVISLPLAILPGTSALVFYVTGFMLRQYSFFSNHTPNILEVVLLILLWIGATFLPDRPLGMVTCSYPIYPLSVIGGIAATIIIYWGCRKITSLRLKPINTLLWFGEVSLTFLCLHLIDLNIPVRNFLGINNALTSIIFDLTFCILGTILLSQFSITREIFKLKKINIEVV